MPIMKTLEQIDSPIQVAVRVVFKGDGYGQWIESEQQFARTHEKREPLVEFYDAQCNFKPFGAQFVSRYYLSTLLESRRNGRNNQERGGLCLDGGVPEWNVGPEDMAKAMQFVIEQTGGLPVLRPNLDDLFPGAAP